MLALRLPEEIECRLASLAKWTGRSKSLYARKVILDHLDDLEAKYVSSGDTIRNCCLFPDC